MATRVLALNIGGATAMGLCNPKSQTNALPVFEEYLRAFPGEDVLVMMGEVDCGFLIWWRAQTKGLSVESQLQQSLARYQAFVRGLQRDQGRVVVVSAPLPTLPDDAPPGPVADARREVRASQRQRTDLTLRYNDRMARWAEAEDVTYVDVSDELLDPATNLIHERFRRPDPGNHHLADGPYAAVLESALRSIGYS